MVFIVGLRFLVVGLFRTLEKFRVDRCDDCIFGDRLCVLPREKLLDREEREKLEPPERFEPPERPRLPASTSNRLVLKTMVIIIRLSAIRFIVLSPEFASVMVK